MNTKPLVLVVMVLALGLALAAVFFKYRPTPSPRPLQPSEIQIEANVTAQNNRLEPQNFQLLHLETLNLHIKAVDRDYTFTLPDFNLNVSLPQGETTTVKLVGEGVGTYEYTCGQNCSGSVEVSPEPDVGE